MAGKKIGLVLALDGEKEFTQALQNAKKEANLFKTEIKNLSQEFEGSANSMAALQAKQEALTRQQQAYQTKLDAAKAGLSNANKAYNQQSDALSDLKKRLEEAQKAQQKMEDAGDTTSDAYKEQCKQVKELSEAVHKQHTNVLKASGRVTDWNKRVAESESELRKANNALDQNEKYLREAETATDHCAASIDNMGNEVKDAEKQLEKLGDEAKDTTNTLRETGDGASVFGDVVKGNLASSAVEKGLEIVAKGAEAVKESMYDISGASSNLAAQTGATAQKMELYKKVMLAIRGNNFGEDYNDVSEAMATVIQMMGELDDAELQSVTENAIALRDAFGMDYQESLRTVKMLTDQFKISSEEAFNLIVQGAQQGLNKNGDLLDTINEYSVHYAQMGTTADEFFNSLKNGTDAGTFSVDKLGDAYKEFGIRVKDTATTTDEAYEILGMDADKMREKFAKGGKSASNATKEVVTALMNMDDKVKQNQAGVDLFGTMWEDLGIEGVKALTNLEGSISSAKGAMEALKEVKYDDLESAISGLGATAQEKLLAPIANTIEGPLTTAINTVTKVIDGIGEKISPQEEEIRKFAENAEAANNVLKTSIENGRATIENAELEATKVETLGQQLLSLNGIENKSLAQKGELQLIVQQLGETIPEVAEAYDAEAGKVNLTNSEIINLIGSTKELILTQAMQATQQENINALLEAQVQYDAAKKKAKESDQIVAFYQEQLDALEELYNKQTELSDTEFGEQWAAMMESFGYQEQLASGTLTMANAFGFLNDQMYEAQGTSKTAHKEMDELSGTISEGKEEIDAQARAIEELLTPLQEAGEKAEQAAPEFKGLAAEFLNTHNAAEKTQAPLADAGKTAEDTGIKFRDAGEIIGIASNEAADSVGDMAEAIADAEKTAAAAAEAGADAQKEAMQSVLDTYHGYASEIESDLQNKISLFDKFDKSDGGEDMTVEKMTKNLDSQIEAFEEYQKNLEAVKEHVGKEIAPEFMQYLESMGMDGANTLKHILATFDDGEAYKVKEMSDKWCQAWNMTEGIAEVQAANKIAYETMMNELGSSDADFSALREAIDGAVSSAAEGWENLPDATEAALEQTVKAAQLCGVKIPDGLAEGIASGEVSPESAIAQLNGTIQGALDGLAEIAKKMGISIPTELTAGIDASSPDVVDAYSKLVNEIFSGSGELEKKVTEEASNAGDSMAAGLEGKTEEVGAAGDNMAQAGADEAKNKADEYRQAGEDAGEAYSKGIENTKGQAENAAKEISQTAITALQNAINEFRNKGQESAARYAEAINAAKGQVGSAGGGLGSAAYSGAASWENALYNVGYNMASGMASGVDAGSPLVAEAVRRVVRNAKNAGNDESDSHSPSRVFRKQVGYNLPAGIAEGILDGQDKVMAASRKVARAALTASKKELDINSPSTKFRDQVGQMIAIGFANGISSNADLAANAAQKMSSKIYIEATAWMTKYKKKHSLSLEDEAWYWQQITSVTQKGTTAYNKAVQKFYETKNAASQKDLEENDVFAKKIKSNFGVSKTKTTGSGKNQKTTNKSKSDYFSEIYQEASSYMDNMQVIYNVSLEQLKTYWSEMVKSIEKQGGKGTQAWYDAKKQLKSVKEEIAAEEQASYDYIISAAEQYVSNQKTVGKMSVEQELEYWRNIQKGAAKGSQAYYDVREKINDAKERLTEEEEKKTEKIVSNAEDYIRKQQILGKSSAEKELARWEKARKALEKGGKKYSDAWYTVMENINNAQQAVEDAKKEKYDSIVSNAEDYIRKQQILGKMSVEQELEYWRNILKQIKDKGGKYSDAWYEVYETIKNLKKEIAEDAKQAAEDVAQQAKDTLATTASVQSSILSKYKVYYKVSAKAEMEYWNIARQQFKAGTDERIEADQNYFAALQNWYDQRKELDEEYAKNSKEINDELIDNIQDLQDAYKDAVKNRKEEILSSMNLFEAWDSSGYDGDTLIYNLKTQVAGLTLWEQQLEELSRKNISAGLLEELREMGPDAAASIYSLNQMTAEKLDEYNKLWEQKNALAESQAVKENEKLRVETNSEIAQLRIDAQAELNMLNADYRAALAELNTGLSDGLKNLVTQSANIGEDAVSGLIAGIGRAADSVDTYNSTTRIVSQISGQLSSLKQEGEIIGKNTLDGILAGLTDYDKIQLASAQVVQSIKRAMEEEAEIHSPSRLFRRETGPQIPAGVALGMKDGTREAVKSAQEMMRDTLSAAQEEMKQNQAALQEQAGLLDFSGIARLNHLTESYQPQAPVVNVDNSGLIAAVQQITAALPEMIAEALSGMQMVTDTGVLAGQLQPYISQESAAIAVRRNRGRR